jgi:hypothetical protein
MRCTLPSDEVVNYESLVTAPSRSLPGVTFTIRRVSLGLRAELVRRVRELSSRIEFLEAGDALQERIEANSLAQEIDLLYIRWGLVRIGGLSIDGEAPDIEAFIARGPEDLAREIAAAVKRQTGLAEEERKN